ncbi:hypothetical protein ACTACD_14220 [Pseudomonas syringae]|uniref:hypothetical protein n=1 Tax=Pseudomonas syringae TaxID=317 RepID=UPI003F776827
MTRTLDALKLIVEELEEHLKRLDSVERGQQASRKVADYQAREIEQLKTRVRDMEIREKIRTGVRQNKLAEEYGLSTGRISQIANNP